MADNQRLRMLAALLSRARTPAPQRATRAQARAALSTPYARGEPVNALARQPEAPTSNWLSKPVETRSQFLPLKRTDLPGLLGQNREYSPALPGLLADALDAAAVPWRAMQGQPVSEQDAVNFGLTFMGGGLLGSRMAPAPRGSVGMNSYPAYKGSGWPDDMTAETFARRAESVKMYPDKVFPGAGFFTSNPAVANTFAQLGRNPKVFPVKLNMRNPKVIDARGLPAREFQWGAHKDEFLGALRDERYDGVILRNTADEGDVFVPKRQEQVLSSITGRQLVESKN